VPTVHRIGLIADTHGLVRPEAISALAGVDEIIHAGDVGGGRVLAALAEIARVHAVYGNVDDPHDPALARERVVVAGGITIHVSHGHELGRPTPALALARYHADVVVFGHTHRSVVFRDPGGRLVVNPGAAGPRRFDLRPSVALLTIERRETRVEIVPLADGGSTAP
jgi:putative phosphoesterase